MVVLKVKNNENPGYGASRLAGVLASQNPCSGEQQHHQPGVLRLSACGASRARAGRFNDMLLEKGLFNDEKHGFPLMYFHTGFHTLRLGVCALRAPARRFAPCCGLRPQFFISGVFEAKLSPAWFSPVLLRNRSLRLALRARSGMKAVPLDRPAKLCRNTTAGVTGFPAARAAQHFRFPLLFVPLRIALGLAYSPYKPPKFSRTYLPLPRAI